MSIDSVLRVGARGLLVGIVAGLVAGVGARVAMRVVADASPRFPQFTAEGSAVVLVLGLLYGIAGGVGYVFARERLSRPWAGRALALGLLGLSWFGPIFLLEEELAIAPQLGRLSFSVLFVLVAAVIGILGEHAASRVRTAGAERTTPVVRVLGGVGWLVALVVAAALGGQIIQSAQRAMALLTSR
jgi:hypothetical protein